MMRRIAFALTALLGLAVAADDQAHAQALNAFSPISQASLSVTTSSARAALATPIGPTALVVNTGSNTAYVRLGNAAVTAATTDTFLGAGCAFAFSSNGQTYVSAITASSTTTLAITTGGGIPTLPNSGCAVSGGGSGVTSIAGTANQITASAATGAVTLSIPSDFRLPGTINLLTLTQPATAATLTLANNSSLITAGAFATTLTSSATTNSTLPAGTHSLAPLDSPSFTTPTIGVAVGTSLALGGATPGGNALAVTGAGAFSGVVTALSFTATNAGVSISTTGGNGFRAVGGGFTIWEGDGLWLWANASAANSVYMGLLAANNLRQGNVPSATPAAQIFTLGEASIAGTSNNGAGASGTLQAGGAGTGNATGSPFIIQTPTATTSGTGGQAYATRLTINETLSTFTNQVRITNITSDAALTDSTVCQDTTNHQLYSGSGTLGICLGTSSARYKRDIAPLHDGLAQIAALQPKNFFYLKGYGDNGAREQYGFLAEDVVHVLPKLVPLDKDGKPNSVDILGMVPILVKAIQEQQGQIAELKSRLDAANDNHIVKASLQ